MSTLDLTGHFLLLAGRDGEPWIQASATVAGSGGPPLDAYCIGKDLGDPDARFAEAYGISSLGASLVRPDGFIGWRSHGGSPAYADTLRAALARSLRN